MERLQKVIANSGYCSRRKAEELIKQGKVLVNGEVVTELGTKVGPKDTIEIDGIVLGKEEKEYILLYKPRGVVTTTDDEKKRKTVVDLVQTNKRIYPVGRLDYDTTGALILTNDGELANMLMHPKSNVEKVYIAKVKGNVDGKVIQTLANGVVIDGRKTSKARVKLRKQDKKEQTSIIELTIHEGRNHQVKKMFEAVGCEVIKLKRERIAFLNLKGLNAGEYRHLTPKEVKKLYGEIKKS
jgi:23S rRNA pseudouridine2605 synthase